MRDKNFLLLWTGQFVSQMGDKLAAVALPWLVYQHTGSEFSTGVVFALYTLPYALMGTPAGVVVDRFNKRTIMLSADLLRALFMAMIPLVAEFSVVAIYALAFLAASLTALFEPAKLAILPEIVPATRLLRANSLLAIAENITEVVGYGFAGLLLATVSTSTAFQLDAMTFVGSAVALACMTYHPTGDPLGRHAQPVFRELKEGLRYLMTHRGLLANTAMSVGAAAGAGATYPLTFLFAVRILHGGPKAFGYLEGALGLGFLGGSLMLASAARRVHKGTAMIAGLALTGLGFVLLSLVSSTWLAAAILLLGGVANAAALIAVDTYVQQAVPEALRGRVWGTRFTLTQGTYALSALAAGALAAAADTRILLVMAGSLIAFPAIAGSFIGEIRDA